MQIEECLVLYASNEIKKFEAKKKCQKYLNFPNIVAKMNEEYQKIRMHKKTSRRKNAPGFISAILHTYIYI